MARRDGRRGLDVVGGLGNERQTPARATDESLHITNNFLISVASQLNSTHKEHVSILNAVQNYTRYHYFNWTTELLHQAIHWTADRCIHMTILKTALFHKN